MAAAALTASRGYTLPWRLALLFAACMVPFLGFALWAASHERDKDRDTRAQGALAVSRLVASEVTQAMAHARDILALLAAQVEPAEPLEGLCGPALRRILDEQPRYLQLVVAGPDGRIACGVRPVRPGESIADRDYLRRALDRRAFVSSGPIVSRTTGQPAIAAAYPIVGAAGEVRGAYVISLKLSWLHDLFHRVGLPENAVMSLVDAEGRVMVRHPPLPETLPVPMPDRAAFLSRAVGTNEGVVDSVGLDGIERVVGYTRVLLDPGTHAFLRVGYSNADLNEQARRVLLSGLATFAITLLLAGAIATFSARRLVVQPVHRLIEATRRLRLGRPQPTGLAGQRGEIGELARAFEDMSGRLHRTVRALRALSAGNRTLVSQGTEQQLLEAMCTVAVREGGYAVAMVHYAQHDDDKSLVLRAQAGEDPSYASALNLTWADVDRGRGATGTAVRTGRCDVIHDTASEPRFAPWRELATSRGFRSIIAFPLTVDATVIGAFTLAAREPDAFDEDEFGLLEEMAGDLAFGIGAIRAREQRDAALAAAEHAARHDAATGLPNRAAFNDEVARIVVRAKERGESAQVLIAYMPRMQDLVDGLGMEASRQIVGVLAGRIEAFGREGGVVARVAFDEFGLAIALGEPEDAEATVTALREAFERPVDVSGAGIEVQVSIGRAIIPEHGDDPDLLIRRAGRAAREAARRDLPFIAYSGKVEQEQPGRLAMVAELRRAIDENELLLHYQPKIDLSTGRMLSLEALVRWNHPVKGMVPPAQFIPLAERTGLIRPITLAIVRMAARQQADWIARGLQTPIAINFTARSFNDARFASRFSELIAGEGVPAELIEIEITESSLVEDPEGARRVLLGLRELGCRIAIDDFGTGYSCLSYLVHLPVQALKIDRSFILAMGRSREAYQVVASVISMAQGLGLNVVAEGVETARDVEILRELGCNECQGFYFCKPAPAERIESAWMARGPSSAAGSVS